MARAHPSSQARHGPRCTTFLLLQYPTHPLRSHLLFRLLAAKPPSPPPADVDAEGGKSGPGPPAQTSVFNAVLVRARKFYGFHEQDSMFIKISLLNPGLLSR